MKIFIFTVLITFGLAFAFTGCGYTSRDNELIGQVKKIKHMTPIICPEWVVVDISLGVMRDGVGSMSTQDVWLTVDKESYEKLLREANEKGVLVKVKYDERRIVFCSEKGLVVSVEVLE